MCVLLRTRLVFIEMGKSIKDQCLKQNLKIVFILFKIISELENIKQDDVKDEAEEKNLKAELRDLFEAPQYQPTEATMLFEKSPQAKGKLNPKSQGGDC